MEIIVALLILAILVLILLILFEDEKRVKKSKTPSGKVTGVWNGSERRASIRVPVDLRTRYYVDTRSSTYMENTRGKNISLGGILLELYEKIYPQTMLMLDIFLPEERIPIPARGEVVWIHELPAPDGTGRRSFNAGIKFTRMDNKDKERLDSTLKGLVREGNGQGSRP